MTFGLSSLVAIVAVVAAGIAAYFAWQGNVREELTTVGKTVEETKSKVGNIDTQIKGGILSVPRGAVISFNLTECPEEGWREYKQAYGKFIRGIDKSKDEIDPAGERTPGSLQQDEMGKHSHPTTIMVPNNDIDGVDSTTKRSGEHHNQSRGTGYYGGAETRPKNVALLFCEKL